MTQVIEQRFQSLIVWEQEDQCLYMNHSWSSGGLNAVFFINRDSHNSIW